MLELYRKALKEHNEWKMIRFSSKEVPKMKQMYSLQKATGGTGNAYLERFQDCLKFIDDAIDNLTSNTCDKPISTYDKFKLALTHMQMIEYPHKFDFLRRFVEKEQN